MHEPGKLEKVWTQILLLIFSLNWSILTYNLSFACVSPNMIVAKLISKFIDLAINGKQDFNLYLYLFVNTLQKPSFIMFC